VDGLGGIPAIADVLESIKGRLLLMKGIPRFYVADESCSDDSGSSQVQQRCLQVETGLDVDVSDDDLAVGCGLRSGGTARTATVLF
jgi:hypothetical protein